MRRAGDGSDGQDGSAGSGAWGVRGGLRGCLLLAGLLLALGAIGMEASADDCRGDLRERYLCDYIIQGQTATQHMTLFFSDITGPEFSGPEVILSGPETGGIFIGECACTAKKAATNKPEKIGFRENKGIQCVVFQSTFSGSEQFLFGAASYVGKPKKNKLEKGEAVDRRGRALVFNCLETPIP